MLTGDDVRKRLDATITTPGQLMNSGRLLVTRDILAELADEGVQDRGRHEALLRRIEKLEAGR